MRTFWTWFWVIWLLMLVIGDPLAVYLGNKDKLGDGYTDTHFLVTHISMGIRVAIIAWLAYHFLIAHKLS